MCASRRDAGLCCGPNKFMLYASVFDTSSPVEITTNNVESLSSPPCSSTQSSMNSIRESYDDGDDAPSYTQTHTSKHRRKRTHKRTRKTARNSSGVVGNGRISGHN